MKKIEMMVEDRGGEEQEMEMKEMRAKLFAILL